MHSVRTAVEKYRTNLNPKKIHDLLLHKNHTLCKNSGRISHTVEMFKNKQNSGTYTQRHAKSNNFFCLKFTSNENFKEKW